VWCDMMSFVSAYVIALQRQSSSNKAVSPRKICSWREEGRVRGREREGEVERRDDRESEEEGEVEGD
jgi:hypothetical protein